MNTPLTPADVKHLADRYYEGAKGFIHDGVFWSYIKTKKDKVGKKWIKVLQVENAQGVRVDLPL